MCDYHGYEFGAGTYPDSVCIDGRLHDADDCDGQGHVRLKNEDIPCPVCRPKDAIAWWADRNALFVDDDEAEQEGARRAHDCAVSLVNDIRKNRGLAAAA